jgi:deazaflavin-dependent oxidoreductase (nitroreductase family)
MLAKVKGVQAGTRLRVGVPRSQVPQFLYLTTTGWRTGGPHQIEIWFVEDGGRYYIVAEFGRRAHWVQNVRRHPDVAVRVGNATFPATGRLVDRRAEAELAQRISTLMQAKYGWSKGLIVELTPTKST